MYIKKDCSCSVAHVVNNDLDIVQPSKAKVGKMELGNFQFYGEVRKISFSGGGALTGGHIDCMFLSCHVRVSE